MEGPTASERMPFGVLIDRSGDRVLLALSGEFGVDAGKRFEEAVEELEREPVTQLIVDLSGITFIDSTAAFLLLDLHKRFSGRRARDVRGRLRAGPEHVRGGRPRRRAADRVPRERSPPAPARRARPRLDANPGHPHHPHPYIGLPRREMPPRRRP